MLPPTAEFLGRFLTVRWEYLRRRDRTAATCSVATTFLLGDESHALFHRSHQSLSAALPEMTTVRVPGATHLLPVTHPATVANTVRAAT